MSARRTILAGAALLMSVAPMGAAAAGPAAPDVLIIGGEIHDGTGKPGRSADVGIRDDRIVFIGSAQEAGISAEKVIDARGMLVLPGFIDPHTHADGALLSENRSERTNAAYLRQGVTSVVIGNDGGGDPEVAELARRVEALGVGTNVGMLVGFGSVRREIVGERDRAPTPAELAAMKARVAKAVCEGALGFSTGLHYAPQSFAEISEIAALAREAGIRGGIYDSHLRDESSYSIGLEASVAEAIEIGRRSGAPVHIAHIKALGPDVWGKSATVIEMIDEARRSGLRVTADQYPWRASGTRISNALVPRWALDGGMDGLRRRLDSPEVGDRLRVEMNENLRRRGGAGSILLTRGFGEAAKWNGKTLAEVATATGTDPVEAAVVILRTADARVASFNMSEADVEAFAVQPWVMTGSDGSTGHPRKYASYPKAYRDLVSTGKLTLPQFVRRSSGLVADTLGLEGRGYLEEGAFADIAIVDPSEFAPKASYTDPEVLSTGVRHLFVNGRLAVDEGAVTGLLAGRPLLHDGDGEICQ